MIFSLIVIFAVAIAAVLFSSYNPAMVQVSLFGYWWPARSAYS